MNLIENKGFHIAKDIEEYSRVFTKKSPKVFIMEVK